LKYEKIFQGRSEGVWQGCRVRSSESWSMAKLWRRVFFSQWMSSGLLIWRPRCKSLQEYFEMRWDATSTPTPYNLNPMSCDLGEFTSAYKCMFVVRVRNTAQSGAKPRGLWKNLFWPNVFKKFPARIHGVTFGRNGLDHRKRLWEALTGDFEIRKNFPR